MNKFLSFINNSMVIPKRFLKFFWCKWQTGNADKNNRSNICTEYEVKKKRPWRYVGCVRGMKQTGIWSPSRLGFCSYSPPPLDPSGGWFPSSRRPRTPRIDRPKENWSKLVNVETPGLLEHPATSGWVRLDRGFEFMTLRLDVGVDKRGWNFFLNGVKAYRYFHLYLLFIFSF